MCVWGGAKVYAGKVYASISVANDATWDAGSNTMGFTGVNGWQILLTGLPAGDITGYTKFHANLSDLSDNIENIRLCIKDKDDDQAWYNLVSGENNVDFATLATAYPDCDFSNVADITLWSPSSSVSTVDGEHPATVKIQNVYLQTPKNIPSNNFGDEITSLDDITDGTKFVIGDGTRAIYWTTSGVDGMNDLLNSVPSDSYCYYELENVAGLDLDGDEVADTDNYRIKIVNASGTAFPHPWGHDSYLNYSMYGHLWASYCKPDGDHAYGGDADYYGIWKVVYTSSKGFYLKNAGSNKYVRITTGEKANTSNDVTYLHFYKTISFSSNTELDKDDNEANDAIFDFANATGYDAATHKFTNGGWTFASPVDMSNWDYLVITTINNASAASCKISIADNDGNSVTGNQYTGSVAGTGNDMYLDRWNHQNAIRISMDYLRANKGLDISKIKSLTFADNNGGDIVISIANVYLTDYNNTKINGGYPDGDVKRAYNATGKFGTICLPYKASCAGAVIYEIAGKTASGITLSEVTGLLEAGKPYFYMSADENGQNNEKTVRNVNFFQADLDAYNAAYPVANNGLIGTFSDITAPTGDDYYVLSNNKLYNVDSSVTVGANKAYVNISAITPGLARGFVDLDFNEPTGIETVANSQEVNANSKFFNLAGQRVAQPTKGLYIVNGKKVLVK